MDGRSYSLVIEYDGRGFYGWQRLRDKPTVQAALEAAVEAAFGERVAVQGAGRTDRGAHALGQVAGIRLAAQVAPDDLVAALNAALPGSVRVKGARIVPDSFHPRTSATAKEYEYRIANAPEIREGLAGRVWHVPGRLDGPSIREALPRLIGRHDFATFATRTRFGQKSTVRELRTAELEVEGDRLVFRFVANSFLYHMVRNMVRLLVKVGEGRVEPGRVAAVLAARDRAASPGSAPASGLYLVQVFYPESGAELLP